MRTSVNTDELRMQAEKLLRLKTEVENARQQISVQLEMLSEQSCHAEKAAMRHTIRELRQTMDSLDDLHSDLVQIAAIYEQTDDNVTRMIRALPTEAAISSTASVQHQPVNIDIHDIQWNVIQLADIAQRIFSGQVYMLQYVNYIRPVGRWTNQSVFMIPETSFRVDDWLKYRVMEAYAHEHI